MKIPNTYKFPVVLLFGAFTFFQCNRIVDLQPDDHAIPEEVTNLIPNLFPDATEIRIKTVEKDSLWEADYKRGDEQYYAAFDREDIKYAAQVIGPAVPDELKERIARSAIAGGTFGDFRKDISPNRYPSTASLYTLYRFHDVSYRLEWQVAALPEKARYYWRLTPHGKIRYMLYTGINNLPNGGHVPERIRQYLSDRYFSIFTAGVWFDELNQKTYEVIAASVSGLSQFRFNAQLEEISTTYSPDLAYYKLEELPRPVAEHIGRLPFLEGFSFTKGAQKVTETGVVYSLDFDHHSGEQFSIALGQAGNLIHLQYSGNDE